MKLIFILLTMLSTTSWGNNTAPSDKKTRHFEEDLEIRAMNKIAQRLCDRPLLYSDGFKNSLLAMQRFIKTECKNLGSEESFASFLQGLSTNCVNNCPKANGGLDTDCKNSCILVHAGFKGYIDGLRDCSTPKLGEMLNP